MQGSRAPPRSDAQKLSECINYITHSGGFDSFGQFLLVLLSDLPNLDQVVIQTVSHFLEEKHLRPLLDKIATHRLMKRKSDMRVAIPPYGFRPGDSAHESTFVVLGNT